MHQVVSQCLLVRFSEAPLDSGLSSLIVIAVSNHQCIKAQDPSSFSLEIFKKTTITQRKNYLGTVHQSITEANSLNFSCQILLSDSMSEGSPFELSNQHQFEMCMEHINAFGIHLTVFSTFFDVIGVQLTFAKGNNTNDRILLLILLIPPHIHIVSKKSYTGIIMPIASHACAARPARLELS